MNLLLKKASTQSPDYGMTALKLFDSCFEEIFCHGWKRAINGFPEYPVKN